MPVPVRVRISPDLKPETIIAVRPVAVPEMVAVGQRVVGAVPRAYCSAPVVTVDLLAHLAELEAAQASAVMQGTSTH